MTANSAGTAPIRNITRHAVTVNPNTEYSANTPVSSSRPKPMLMNAADILPTAGDTEASSENVHGAIGHNFGHQRDTDGELTADT